MLIYLFWSALYITLVMIIDFVGDLGVQPTWRVPFYVKGHRSKEHPDAVHYWSPPTLAAWIVITVSLAMAVSR